MPERTLRRPGVSIRAPVGAERTCRGWGQEAALRMLMNTLDPTIAENPEELVVCGGAGKAARDWESYDRIVTALRDLGNDETLFIQSGKPVGVLRSHPDAPRVLISNGMIVPAWADWDHFRDFDQRGLTMDGQASPGSWTYIGPQEHLQTACEVFAAIARAHFGDTLAGRLVLSAGLGIAGAAASLAVLLNGGVFLGVEVNRTRAERRVAMGYCDELVASLDEALEHAHYALERKAPWSIALIGNATDLFQEFIRRGIKPDVVTDLTAAHDPLCGYMPAGLEHAEAERLRESNPDAYIEWALTSIATQAQSMLEMKRHGSVVFEFGNNLRAQAQGTGIENAFDIPGYAAEYVRPLLCEGRGPFQWIALSGDPGDIYRTEQAVIEAFPDSEALHQWLGLARAKVPFHGLPARLCWLTAEERATAGGLFNDLVARGEIHAPLVICRNHMDGGAAASPYGETEGMPDGSDAIADWPILSAMMNAANGATWVAVHHGGGAGIGYAVHTGLAIVADGTPEAARRIDRVLTADPALGLIRHAEAGYTRRSV
jgi:urocanate hydratase